MEAHDTRTYHLTDEQLAEVQRRRANKHPQRIPVEDVFNRFRPPDA
jgi:hypothetical protein